MKIHEPGVLEASDIYFHTPSAAAKSIYYYIETAGHYYCNEEYRVSRDKFMGFLLMYIKDGDGFCVTNGRKFKFSKDDVVLLDSSCPHSYGTSGNLEILWMHFDGSTSRAFFDALTVNTHVFSPVDRHAFHSTFREIIDAYSIGQPLHEAIVSIKIQKLLSDLLLLDIPYESEQHPIKRAIDFIESNYSRPILIEQLSKLVNISPYYFSRRFKQYTGFSPHEFIIITRLNAARHMLLRTRRPIKEIAFISGFGSEAHFVSSFRKHMGTTPKTFRMDRDSGNFEDNFN